MMEVMSYEKTTNCSSGCLVAGAIGFAAVYSTQNHGKEETPTEISQTSSIVEPTEKTPQKQTPKEDSETKTGQEENVNKTTISSRQKNNCILSLKM